MFPLIFGLLALIVMWRPIAAESNRREMKRLRDVEIAKWAAALERDPRNAGAHAELAEKYLEDGKVDLGVHEFRLAIGLMPQGPFATRWKRKLKAALEFQEIVAAAITQGQPVPTFHDWRTCNECEATVTVKMKQCPQCGAVINVTFLDYCLDLENQKDIAKITIITCLVLWIGSLIFSALPLEVKGTLIIASVIVGAYYFLRSFDGLLG